MGQLKQKVEDLRQKVHILAENDPEIIDELDKKVKLAKQGVDRWTGTVLYRTVQCCGTLVLFHTLTKSGSHVHVDNVFNLKSWVVQKRSCPSSEVSHIYIYILYIYIYIVLLLYSFFF
jgi:hypothetical protein